MDISQKFCGLLIIYELFYEDSENDVDHEDKKHFIYQSISTFDEFIPSHHTDSGALDSHSDVIKVKKFMRQMVIWIAKFVSFHFHQRKN